MTTLLQKGAKILRTEGLVPFLRQAYRYVEWRLWPIIRYLRWRVGKWRGIIILDVDSLEAKFVANNKQSVELTLNRFRTENDEIKDFVAHLNKDDVVFDVGANTGLYTCFASQKCTTGEIIAFEPYPPNVSELKKNIEHNGARGSVVEKALSNDTGTANFSSPTEASPGHGTASLTDGKDNGEPIVTVLGDKLVREEVVPQPNVIKIDVEGAESRVIDGLTETLQDDKCRLVYCEVHLPARSRAHRDVNNSRLTAIEDKLEQLGFNVKQMGTRGQEVHLRAQKGD